MKYQIPHYISTFETVFYVGVEERGMDSCVHLQISHHIMHACIFIILHVNFLYDTFLRILGMGGGGVFDACSPRVATVYGAVNLSWFL